MPQETQFRSIAKAASYRCISTCGTALLFWILTGQWRLALLAGGIEAAFKVVTYYFHERLWDCIQFGRHHSVPPVVWFTGLSGSGKTTLSFKVVEELKKRGFKSELLDGDEIRQLIPATGFDEIGRKEHIKRVGILARYLQKNGVAVVVSLISPYQEARDFCRDHCEDFFEIYLSTSIENCEKRDPKGLYQRARKGEIKNFTGIDAPYEVPLRPHLTLDTSVKSIDTCTKEIINLVTQKNARRLNWTILKLWNPSPSSF